MPLLPPGMKQTGISAADTDLQPGWPRTTAAGKAAPNLDKWADLFSQAEIPVLRTTVTELARLKENEDTITARDIARVILQDPLLALKVLRYMQEHRRSSEDTEITTVEHAVMMLGTTLFFRQFHGMKVAEEVLAEHPDALEGFMAVIDRAHHAAMYAWELAALRHDIDSDEIIVATLLHDITEMLLWCLAPEYATQIARKMQRDSSLRSAKAQENVLGFRLIELQLILAKQWHLPGLLQSLMDDVHSDAVRVRNVSLAVALARHSAHGWHDVALLDDYAAIEKLVGVPRHEVMTRIHRATLKAIRGRSQYGTHHLAAWLPPLPAEERAGGEISNGESVETASEVLARVTKLLTLPAAPPADLLRTLSLVFHGMYAGIGLNRVLFMEVNDEHSKATAKYLIGAKEAALLQRLQIDLVHPHVFSRLMGKMEAIWYSAATQNELQSLFLEEMIRSIWNDTGNSEFFAMPILVNGSPVGLIYADGGRYRPILDLNSYSEFQRLCLLMAELLERQEGTADKE